MDKILCLGHCGFDGPRIKSQLESDLDVQVDFADTAEGAMSVVSDDDYSLVLVNRVFDRNGDSGLSWIENNAFRVNCMLVSNYPEAQQKAVEFGAKPGFGKADLGSAKAGQVVAQALSQRT